MSASEMIDKKEDNFSIHTRTYGIKKSTLSTPPARPSPSTRRFQEITKQVISTPKRRSSTSTGMHRNAPALPSLETRSSSSGKERRYSFANVVACASNDVNGHSRLPNGCHSDANRRYSHHDTSSSTASHGGSHYIPSNKSKNGSSLPSSSRISHPKTSSNNHEFSHPASSNEIVNHGASHHPTTSSNGWMSHGSLQGGDTELKNMAEPSFPHRSSHSSSQGKLAPRKLANTSSKLCESRAAAPMGIARIAETYTKSRDSATRHRPRELCKDCKASIMESVCFIGNDGRISAAITGAAYARHIHHCNVSGCAANQSYYPSLSKKDSRSKRQAPLNPQATRTKSHTFSGTGDRGSTASSVQGGEDCSKQEMELSLRGSAGMSRATGSDTHDMKQVLNLKETSHNSCAIKCSEEGDENHEDTDSLCHTSVDQNGIDVFSPCKDRSESPSAQVPKDQQSYGEDSHVENVEVNSTPAASCISSDIHDDDDDKASVYRDDIQVLNDSKTLFYHGDTEYSCSEDGTEATTTPNSLIKGAFDDLSNIDILQSSCGNDVSQPRRSTMAWMRQKYLESLREQEAETVRLRKQEIMARKQAGDWMLDCHMEEVLHKLAPNGEVHVKVLVEAYETVTHHSDSESSQTVHHQDQDLLENLHSYASS